MGLTPNPLTIGAESSIAIDPRALLGSARQHASIAERTVDVVLTLVLAPFLLVSGALIALAIYIDSPGPVIFRSTRVGRGGVPFMMLKFRKMRADAGSGPLTLADDERFTPIGRFLAATRLDELPQIWNVLRGEMRLVGPRPEVDCFVSQFEEEYAEILSVTPGITGFSQLRFVDEKRLLHGPDPATIYRDHVLPEKIKIDLAYVRSRSSLTDLAILAQTVALPFTLLLVWLRARSTALRVWIPTAASAILLVLLFVVASNRIA